MLHAHWGIVATMVLVFLLQATVDAGRLFQDGGAIITLPSDNKAGDHIDVYAYYIPMKACMPASRRSHEFRST